MSLTSFQRATCWVDRVCFGACGEYLKVTADGKIVHEDLFLQNAYVHRQAPVSFTTSFVVVSSLCGGPSAHCATSRVSSSCRTPASFLSMGFFSLGEIFPPLPSGSSIPRGRRRVPHSLFPPHRPLSHRVQLRAVKHVSPPIVSYRRPSPPPLSVSCAPPSANPFRDPASIH